MDGLGVKKQLEVEPSAIHSLMTGYLGSKALFLGVETGLFNYLDSQGRTEDEISKELSLKSRPVRILLKACRGAGLVAKTGELYTNTPVSSKFLVKGKETYMGDLALHQSTHFNNFSILSEALRTNTSITGRVGIEGYANEGAGQKEEREGTKKFVKALHGSAIVQAKTLAKECLLKGEHLADLGCGSGAYSIEIALANPNIKITSMDYPAVCDVASEYVRNANLQDQISFYPGDLFNDPLPTGIDSILLSHVLDGYGRKRSYQLLKRIYAALPTGGQLIIHAHLPERAEASFPFLFNLILLANTAEGEAHDEKTLEAWLNKIGFSQLEIKKISPISSLVTCIKS
ncbi:methyltransferase [Lentibacillus sp. N15]|uniref:methyltransferase n=1 Tax=Lentibacillus songyuanensis TaxID=3136161 RepID=UPI0031BB8AB3